ncbi:MAG: lipocalin-like domain-containing protein [Bacteroidaceae bacterium]|nr:lipocalin-like domain-containing protein [Bacteroidaceae bacterium]
MAFMSVLFFSCDKIDCNGDLDGQWQMIEWISPSGELVGNNEMQIYYSFQLQMMGFQRLSATNNGRQRSSFEIKGSVIRIYDPIEYKGNGHDNILSMDVLSRYGVPLDGIMEIEHLSSQKMVLSSTEKGQLTFRKY